MVPIKQFWTKYAQTFFCIKREDKTEHTLFCGKAGSVWHGTAVFLLTDGDERLVPSAHGRFRVTPVVSAPGRDKSPVTEITFVHTPSRLPQTPPRRLHPHEAGPQAQAPPPAHTRESHSPCSSLLTTHTPAHLDCGPTAHNGGILNRISCILVRPVSSSVTTKLAQSW